MITKQNILNYTYNMINKMDSIYMEYKYANMIFSIFIIYLSGILLYNIFKINIRENVIKDIVISFSCLIFVILLKITTSKSRKLKCRDMIFNLAIDYYRDIYDYIEDTEIENISYVDIINISSVYERCLKLKILDEAQLNNIRNIIKDLIKR